MKTDQTMAIMKPQINTLMATPAPQTKMSTVLRTLTAILVNGPGPPMTQLSGLPQMLPVAAKLQVTTEYCMAILVSRSSMMIARFTQTVSSASGHGPHTTPFYGIHQMLDAGANTEKAM